ncbi:PREDICTED: transmembrane protein 209 [Fragaria vesca subsp. vesca]|uniref:transmembrane protein 209 n=1 Tax=Fragaria vesca subsp. vesca TaxID=101020 RepID=UPI0002C2E0C5|nr:PREDICTED: transmembrane protein 209 [Fragaria vesca subsp. vesca]
MDGRDTKGSSPPPKPSKFSVYQNPTLSAALTANSLRPPKQALLIIFSLSSLSAVAFLLILSRENEFVNTMKLNVLSQEAAYLFVKVVHTVVGLVFLATLVALFRVISLRNAAVVPTVSSSKGTKDNMGLTSRQLGLLGIKPKVEQVVSESAKKPPKSKPYSSSPSDVLVPLHPSISSSNRLSRIVSDKYNTSGNGSPSKSPSSASSLYLVPGAVSPMSSFQNSPGVDSVVSSPWSSKRIPGREMMSEEKFEQFLADVDEKITQSAGKLATPPPTIRSFAVASPSSGNTSGTTRSTPLRAVRMSPGSQKFTTPPKKGEGELPPPMSMEESINAFDRLGIYPQIEQWRDNLRQWFSSVLLNPLLQKTESSHIQVMEAASKLGIALTISQIGSDLPTTGTTSVSSTDRTKEWRQTLTLDEDGVMHQVRATLLQYINASTSQLPQANLQQTPQQNMVPIMQACVDALTEHQRLYALMKGELIKGLLPQSSIRAEYTVQRIRELAEGTCLKNYEYLGSGEVYDKKNKKWTVELPTDSHLLLYLFCAFLEYPKWMLHGDSISHAGARSSKNPLFLGLLPQKESIPEKYIAVVSGVPSALHPGGCVLIVGRKSPPVFAMYLDKKLLFSIQGMTALWDSILLLCHSIRTGYGGIVRGMHLSSSALRILPVLDSETEG